MNLHLSIIHFCHFVRVISHTPIHFQPNNIQKDRTELYLKLGEKSIKTETVIY